MPTRHLQLATRVQSPKDPLSAAARFLSEDEAPMRSRQEDLDEDFAAGNRREKRRQRREARRSLAVTPGAREEEDSDGLRPRKGRKGRRRSEDRQAPEAPQAPVEDAPRRAKRAAKRAAKAAAAKDSHDSDEARPPRHRSGRRCVSEPASDDDLRPGAPSGEEASGRRRRQKTGKGRVA
eukprot:s933_g7.t1